MGVWTLAITINSAMALKAHEDVYLVVSLSGGQKQRAPVHKKKDSSNPWSGHTFVFTINEAAILAVCLKFKIKKAKRIFCLKKCIGQVNVPVRDLLAKGGASDVKPKVMNHEVRSSSEETMAVLHFSYEFGQRLSIEASPTDETVTGNPDAAAPSTSNSAASYRPPVPAVVPWPLGDEPVTGSPAAVAPPASNPVASYPPLVPGVATTPAADEPVTDYPAVTAPPASNSPASYPILVPLAAPPSSAEEPVTGYPATAMQPASNSVASYPPPVPGVAPPSPANEPAPGYPAAVAPLATYSPLMPRAALYTQTAYLANAVPTYGSLLPAGHGYLPLPSPAVYLPTPPSAAPHTQTASLANGALSYGFPPPAHAHPLAGPGYAVPRPHAGWNFVQRVISGVVVDAISNLFGSL